MSHPLRIALVAATTLLTVLSACSVGEDAGGAAGDETLLPVSVDGNWGYINPEGELVVAPRFEGAWRFSNGLALVKSGGRFGFIGPDGTFAVDPRFTDAWHFKGGLAPVELDTTWAYVDRDGRIVADTQHSIQTATLAEMQYDSPALHLISVDGRYGFTTDDGRPVIEPRFEGAWHFTDGVARVKSDGKWGYIDRDGDFVIEPRFDLAWDFSNGVAMVQVDGERGYIDREGRYVWTPER